MDRKQMRVAFLKIALMALVASTWVFWSFIFATRPEEAEAGPLMNLVRLPASLPAQIPGMAPQVKTMDPIEMSVVHIPCWDAAAAEDAETSSRWVRLTGRDCVGPLSADSVSVKNLTNGFSATVFPTQLKTSLTTDFIPLRGGRNDILIRVNREEGAAIENRLTFVRE